MKILTNKGFTLIEILIALVLSAVVMTAIYQTYQSQQRSYIMQEEAAKMQQNLRAALFAMTKDLRMAGYDPDGDAGAGIVAVVADTVAPATTASVRFTRDLNDNASVADIGEDITYSLVADGDTFRLNRNDAAGGASTLAEYIDALDFVFLNADNNPTTIPSEIRTVQITIVARSERFDRDYTNNFIYRNQDGRTVLGSQGDRYPRRILSTRVKCRNIGL
jgi:type IV pilus assembly protein PilW